MLQVANSSSFVLLSNTVGHPYPQDQHPQIWCLFVKPTAGGTQRTSWMQLEVTRTPLGCYEKGFLVCWCPSLYPYTVSRLNYSQNSVSTGDPGTDFETLPGDPTIDSMQIPRSTVLSIAIPLKLQFLGVKLPYFWHKACASIVSPVVTETQTHYCCHYIYQDPIPWRLGL